jgi:hypothetical protein
MPDRFVRQAGDQLMATLVFRSSFAVLGRWTSTVCGIVGGFIYLSGLLSGTPVPFGFTFGVALALGLLFAVAVACFPVYLRPDGIRCYTFCGIYRTLRWEEMARVRVESVVGLRYLVASSQSGWREIWIPLYLSDMPKFIRAVRGCIGDEHALVQALKRYGGPAAWP